MRLLASLALAATVVASGCHSSTTAPRGPALAVRVEAAGLRLENLTDERLYYAAVDRETLALIDLHFCNADPESCANRIEPRATTTVPFDHVVGYGPRSREIAVYHWHLRPPVTATGYQSYLYDPLTVRIR